MSPAPSLVGTDLISEPAWTTGSSNLYGRPRTWEEYAIEFGKGSPSVQVQVEALKSIPNNGGWWQYIKLKDVRKMGILFREDGEYFSTEHDTIQTMSEQNGSDFATVLQQFASSHDLLPHHSLNSEQMKEFQDILTKSRGTGVAHRMRSSDGVAPMQIDKMPVEAVGKKLTCPTLVGLRNSVECPKDASCHTVNERKRSRADSDTSPYMEVAKLKRFKGSTDVCQVRYCPKKRLKSGSQCCQHTLDSYIPTMARVARKLNWTSAICPDPENRAQRCLWMCEGRTQCSAKPHNHPASSGFCLTHLISCYETLFQAGNGNPRKRCRAWKKGDRQKDRLNKAECGQKATFDGFCNTHLILRVAGTSPWEFPYMEDAETNMVDFFGEKWETLMEEQRGFIESLKCKPHCNMRNGQYYNERFQSTPLPVGHLTKLCAGCSHDEDATENDMCDDDRNRSWKYGLCQSCLVKNLEKLMFLDNALS